MVNDVQNVETADVTLTIGSAPVTTNISHVTKKFVLRTYFSHVVKPIITNRNETSLSRPYPEILNEAKNVIQVDFDFLTELKILHVQIPFLQEIQDFPIYSKTVKELCIKNLGRKPQDPSTMYVIGKLYDLILGNNVPTKFEDPGNPTVNLTIGGMILPNILLI